MEGKSWLLRFSILFNKARSILLGHHFPYDRCPAHRRSRHRLAKYINFTAHKSHHARSSLGHDKMPVSFGDFTKSVTGTYPLVE